MSNYLLITSAFRNRILYPNPSDFIVPFQSIHSLNTNLSVLNTYNPITIFPIYNFCWTNYLSKDADIFETLITGGGGNTIRLGDNVLSQLLGINELLKENVTPNPFVQQLLKNSSNILKGFQFSYKNSIYLITSYSVVYNTITISESISFVIGDSCKIINQILNDTVIFKNGDINPYLLIGEKFYLYNISINEIRPCVLNSLTDRIIIDPPFSKKQSVLDKYFLFQSIYPLIKGRILPFENGKYFLENTVFSFKILYPGTRYQNQEIIYLQKDKESITNPTLFRIKRIGSQGEILELDMEEIGNQEFDRNEVYKIFPQNERSDFSLATLLIEDVSTVFMCEIKNEVNAPTRVEDFIGNYFFLSLLSRGYNLEQDKLKVSPNNTYPVPILNEIDSLQNAQFINGVFGIKKAFLYNNKKVILFVEKITSLLLLRFRAYQNLSIKEKEGPVYKDALHFSIFRFLSEGVSGLNFTGTYLTQSQTSCYELSVINLILPNQSIDSFTSLLTSAFPYVFLEISNVTMPSGRNRNSIYTNNPFGVTSTFVCSISDINDPQRTKFIKISSDGAVQILKFTPADNLRFRILLPSGEPLLFKDPDYFPPSKINPALQIEVLLQIKKL